jgi:hypothetical protein
MKVKIIAIHQPNFFPWLGYFNKINKSDVFIFLDDVQYPKTGGSWSNRVKFLISGTPNWVTATIDRNYSGTRNINEMRFQTLTPPWQDKMMKSLENSYKKHPFYSEIMPVLEPLLRNDETNIADYNVHAVTQIASLLGMDLSKFKRSSDMHTIGSSNELLCELTSALSGTIYMCGGGADGYQDEAIFTERGLKLQYQNFQHPVYAQRGQTEFVPGLSIIDALMNVGAKGVADLLQPKI